MIEVTQEDRKSTLEFPPLTASLHDTEPYQEKFPWEAVVFTPVQVLEGVLSFSCSQLHQTAEGTLLYPDSYLLTYL